MKKSPRKGGSRSGNPIRRAPRFSQDVEVLYEDDAVAAINKPAGLPAVPVKGSDTASALSMLAAELRRKRQRAVVVHRIDRFTSGIMLFAKSEPDKDMLVRQFLRHTPVRQYLAVVRGTIPVKEATLVHYLRKEGMFQKVSGANDSNAARAELSFVVERPLRDATLVRATLVTGLQNQIRVQFSAMGHPVIGDRKYHPEEATERRIARVALHATQLQFIHPRSREVVKIDCGLPPDLKSLLKALSLAKGPRA